MFSARHFVRFSQFVYPIFLTDLYFLRDHFSHSVCPPVWSQDRVHLLLPAMLGNQAKSQKHTDTHTHWTGWHKLNSLQGWHMGILYARALLCHFRSLPHRHAYIANQSHHFPIINSKLTKSVFCTLFKTSNNK